MTQGKNRKLDLPMEKVLGWCALYPFHLGKNGARRKGITQTESWALAPEVEEVEELDIIKGE